ncbi:MAG: DUF4368 domain-containing protein, partial [Eggerthia catenaformis]|uniref:DUF4368 domain-containing protein n=1 Tax=Eggerthia catenaformis TaxID=31973 RepID=UPI003FA046A0
NFKTEKHYKDKRNHYVDKSKWQIIENVHEPIIDRSTYENVQRILKNAPVKRPNGVGEIHALSGLMYCKDCGTKMHIRTIHKNGKVQHVTYCSEYAKGKAQHPKCHSPHRIDVDDVMETLKEVLRKIGKFSFTNKSEFEALVKSSLAKEQTEEIKKQKKRIPQITDRMEQIERVMNKLYEDNALGNIGPKRYEQLSGKYAEEYYSLKAEQEQIEERLSEFENANQRAKNFIKLAESYSDFEELTPTAINEFINKIVVHERDVKRAKYAVQRIEVYFNYIGKFENELTKEIEPTEQEMIQMREEIEEAKKEKTRAYHRAYSKEYRSKNIDKFREYERIKAREYRARKKLQAVT